jgi:hypothetical protein
MAYGSCLDGNVGAYRLKIAEQAFVADANDRADQFAIPVRLGLKAALHLFDWIAK